RTTSTPTLLRAGLSDALELRLETDGFLHERSRDAATGTDERRRGFADASLGLKWHMRDGDEAAGTPGIAWLAHLDLETGSSAFRGQGVRPSLRMVAEWELPNEMAIGVMPGLMLDRDADGKRFAAGILAVTLSKGWTPAWRTFVEVAGQQLASKRHGGNVITFDTGATWLVTDDLQFDVSVARGLTSNSPDWQWGVGMAVRF
ncbi:MAG: transporter, partial [Solirubrobacteraceae bacterium]|nr:transporter [Solirubrobacteraceae bacterium]